MNNFNTNNRLRDSDTDTMDDLNDSNDNYKTKKILIVTETWLKDESCEELSRKLGLKVYISNRVGRTGGGVLIGLEKNITVPETV